MNKPRIFIDGESGTTGLKIREHLSDRNDIELVGINVNKRKDVGERKRLLNSVDLAILCLPDDAAIEAVGLIENPNVRVLDASTAHRIAPGWVYGFPELATGQKDKIRSASRVSNPGCYATGAIALLHPLISRGLMPSDYPVSICGISGYSGGGNALIERCESDSSKPAFRLYGLGGKHKHLPEIVKYSGLKQAPLFMPSYVGHMKQGMLIEIPVHSLPAEKLHAAFTDHYAGQSCVKVMPFNQSEAPDCGLSPDALNDTNVMELYVYANDLEQTLLVARLDNLGKGASGAAVQNLEIMLSV
ncbi:MAG: N-acetyl-gamma-glutamyl-phosphate reductase [Alphaproteobacteria bacterium]|nr:N-acetyl-gamma-glutamyl-phosphate reductase [Alphaproteobacteria bacterium]